MDEDIDWESAFADDFEAEDSCHVAKKPRLEARQFPGPAGIIPRNHGALQQRSLIPASTVEEAESDQQSLTRKELIETNSAWLELDNEDKFGAERKKYDSEFVKNEVKKKGFSFKIPIFSTVLKSVDLASGLDPSCEFIDSRGEISGMMHRDVIEEYGEQLRPGTALMLKNALIMVPRKKTSYYINVTLNNIVAIYCNDHSDFGVTATRVCTLTKEDLQKLQAEIEKENKLVSLTTSVQQQQVPRPFSPHSNIRPLTVAQPYRPPGYAGQPYRPPGSFARYLRPRTSFSPQMQQSSSFPRPRFQSPPPARFVYPQASVSQSVSANYFIQHNEVDKDSVAQELLGDLDEDSIFGDF